MTFLKALPAFWKRYRLFWRIITVIFAIIIFVLCIAGIENFPKEIFFLSFIDIIYHFTGFSIFSFLLAGSFYSCNKINYQLSLSTGIIWSFVCEGIQLIVPDRSFTLWDLAANISAILLIQILMIRMLEKLKSESNPCVI